MNDPATWGEVADACARLAQLISADYKPTRLIALTRGGWFPALMLSHLLDVRDLASIGVRYSDAERQHLVVVGPMPTVGSGDHVLLIEDFLLSGKSLRQAATLLHRDDVHIKTASLGYLSTAVVTPDYSLGASDTPPSFPWERPAPHA
jgi:hypoxanthine phosphoribosyltransferase